MDSPSKSPASPPQLDAMPSTTAAPEHVAVATTVAAEPLLHTRTEEATRMAEPRVGQTVHKYQLIRELGRGGMGIVFLARDTRLGRLVAIKFLHGHNPARNARFIAEARTTARCQHENIVVLYEAHEYDGHPYMVLEYLEGKTLRQLMDEARDQPDGTPTTPDPAAPRATGGLSVERSTELIVPVLRALQQAHSMGIIHRDLKPENVMLTESGTVKVLDFGIAKLLTPDEFPGRKDAPPVALDGPPVASTRGLVGTPPYMSPEQLRADAADHRTDIWSVGIMLFEMVTGRHPLAPLSFRKLQRLSRYQLDMPRTSDIRPDVGRLGPIIDRALLVHKDDRTSTASQFLAELEPFLADRRDPALGADSNPFAGLAAFQESDSARFFGRGPDISGVVTRVRSQPLIAVVGPSGVGKSSLVRAGVIPRLKHSGEGWETFVVRPGRAPLASLAQVLLRLLERTSTDAPTRSDRTDTSAPTNSEHGPAVVTRLAAEPGYLGSRLREWAQRKLRRVLLFVDQFEEIYTLGTEPDERRAFLACLTGVADDASSPLRVVLSMRADFLERMAEDRAFMASATRGLVFLAPIDRAGLREALTRPVEAVRYRFETDDMVENMLDALETTRGALPLLQFVASQLWEVRDRERRLLTATSYRSIGGISGTLARHADQVLARMSAQRIRLVRAIFERLVTPERTRAIASVCELCQLPGDPDDIEDVLHDLADARLVVIETTHLETTSDTSPAGGQASGSVEIVHESLIDGWPTLRRWQDENQEHTAFRARLRAVAKDWHKNDAAEGLLWRGAAADEARRWRDRYPGELPEREEHYLRAVFALAERAQRRKRYVLYGIMGALAAVAVAASVGIVTVLRQNDTIRAKVEEVERQKAIISDKVDALSQKERALEDSLAKERAARSEAEKATANALSAQRYAEEQKSRAEKATQVAQGAERAARAAKADADRSARIARDQKAKAERATESSEAERAKAEKAAEETARSEAEKQQIIDRAVGNIKRKL